MRGCPAGRRAWPVHPGNTANMPRQYRPRPGDVYWRRRVIALAAGIAVLGVIVWTVNGTLGSGGASPSANVSSVVATTRPRRPGRPHRSRVPPAPPRPGQRRHRPPPRRRPRPKTSTRPGRTAGVRPRPARGLTSCSACSAPGTATGRTPLRASRSMWSPRPPGAACSTWPAERRADHQSGDHRVWGSADCQASSRPHSTRLVRGVPTVLQISWNRKTSAPGCHQPRKFARPGTYTATARSGKIRSQPMIFVLSASGT